MSEELCEYTKKTLNFTLQASQVAKGLRILISLQELQEPWVQSLGQEDPLE